MAPVRTLTAWLNDWLGVTALRAEHAALRLDFERYKTRQSMQTIPRVTVTSTPATYKPAPNPETATTVFDGANLHLGRL
jgi:hypothetical protein